MNEFEIQHKVNQLSENGEWNCYYEFPHGVVTRKNHIDSPGYNLKKWPRLKSILVDDIGLKGKTVVDVGCGDGYYSIQCAKSGAKHCLGTDIDSLRIQRATLAKELLKVDNVSFKSVDLFEVIVESPQFDIVMGLGLLHRVPDLDLCINRLASLGGCVILEVKTLDDPRAIRNDKGGESKSNAHNGLWSVPTKNYIIEKMSRLGLELDQVADDTESKLNYKRTILVFKK